MNILSEVAKIRLFAARKNHPDAVTFKSIIENHAQHGDPATPDFVNFGTTHGLLNEIEAADLKLTAEKAKLEMLKKMLTG